MAAQPRSGVRRRNVRRARVTSPGQQRAERTGVVELALYTLLFLLVALAFDPTIDVQFTLPKLMWLRFGMAPILAVWVVRLIQGGVRPVPRIVLVPAAVLAGWWVVVTPIAADVRTAIDGMHGRYNGLINGILLIVLFLVVASTARARPELRRLVVGFLIAIIPVAAYAMAQYSGLDPFVWPNPRPGSTIGHPVPLAAILSLAIPFVLAFLIVERGSAMRIAWSALLLLYGFAVASTLSRGPWLGGLAACGTVVVAAVRLKIVSVKGPARWWSLGVLAIAAAFLVRSAAVLHRLEQFVHLGTDPSFTGRFVFFDAAFRMIRAHPITGVGLENFGVLYPQYRPLEPETVPPDSVPTMVHNGYLQAATTTGIIGLTVSLALSAGIFLLLNRSCRGLALRLDEARAEGRSDRADESASELMFGVAFGAALIGYMIQALSGWDEVSLSAFYWILGGAAVAFSTAERTDLGIPSLERLKIPVALAASAGAAGAIVLGFDASRQIEADRAFRQARSLSLEKDWALIERQLQSGLAASGDAAIYLDHAGLFYLRRVAAVRDPTAYVRAAALFEKSAGANRFDPYTVVHRIDLETAALTAGIVQTLSVDAKDAVARARALDPNNATVHASIAALQQAAHDPVSALRTINEAIRLRPHHPGYHVLQGDLQRALGDRAAAIAAYREEVPLVKPASSEWLNVERRLLVTLEEAGQHEPAIAEGKMVTGMVHDEMAFTLLGFAYRSIGDWANAVEAFAAAARINPANVDAVTGLREAEAERKREPTADTKQRPVR
jgi:O-antigen ligase/tetratricopeptide (TPR) repeat protein